MTDLQSQLGSNLDAVRTRIARAAARSGREATAVTLVGITKYVAAPIMAELVACGLQDLGESRVEQAGPKRTALQHLCVTWHMVGHVQRRKAEAVLAGFDCLHSLDSVRLAQRLSRLHAELDPPCPPLACFLQVNVSGETSKYGFSPADGRAGLEEIQGLPGLQVIGLMTMAPYAVDPEATRPVFAALRELRDRWAPQVGVSLASLSMGMSGDFEVAVEEGATHVRVGSALFEGI